MGNKRYQKLIRGSMVGVVAFSGVAVATPLTAFAYKGYSDVKSSAYYYEAVKTLTELGVINGYGDGTYRPNNYVTRGEAAKVFSHILNLDTVNVSNPEFTDVPTTHPFYGSIAALANLGLVNISNGSTFHPNQPIQRNEMALLISTLFNLQATNPDILPFTDVTNEYRGAITALYENNITAGTSPTTFDGSSYVTRGQFAAFVMRSSNISLQQENNEVNLTINSYSDSTIVTLKDEYKVSTSLAKSLFTKENAAALKNASIQAKVEDGVIVEITSLTLNSSGTENEPVTLDGDNVVINGDLKLNSDYIQLKNFTINGDLIVSSNVTSEITVDKVKTSGQLIMEASSNPVASLNNVIANETNGLKINILNSLLQGIKVGRDNSTINSDTEIPLLSFDIGVSSIEVNADVTKMVIDVNIKLEITGNAEIDQLLVQQSTELAVKLIGSIKNLLIDNSSTKIEIGTQLNIETVTLPTNSNPNSIFTNYSQVQQRIQKITDEIGAIIYSLNTNSGSGSSSGSATPSVDKAALNTTIHSVASLNEEDYTVTSWRNLQTALVAAQEILNKTNATQQEVNDANSNLQSAINNLITVDLSTDLGEIFFQNFNMNMSVEDLKATAQQFGLREVEYPIVTVESEYSTFTTTEEPQYEHDYEEIDFDGLDALLYFTNDPEVPDEPDIDHGPLNLIAFGIKDGKVIMQGFAAAVPSSEEKGFEYHLNHYRNLISQYTDLKEVDESELDIGISRVGKAPLENEALRVASLDNNANLKTLAVEDDEEFNYVEYFYKGKDSAASMMGMYYSEEEITQVVFTQVKLDTSTAAVDTFEELKAALEDPRIKTINIYDNIDITEPLVVSSEKHINGNNYVLTTTRPGYYALQFVNTRGSVEDIWITGADAAMLVHGSTVTLSDYIEVSGNLYGGIVVIDGELDITETYIYNDTEANDNPTIWEDNIDGVDAPNQVVGFEYSGIEKIDYNQISENYLQRYYFYSDAYSAPNPVGTMGEFKVTSLGFENGDTIPLKYVSNESGRNGAENISIPLQWSNAPAGTKSFAVVMYDETANNVIHWAAVNIPSGVRSLAEGASNSNMPTGSLEVITYEGPNPPFNFESPDEELEARLNGPHTYTIDILALDVESIVIDPNPLFYHEVLNQFGDHVLGKVTINGVYEAPDINFTVPKDIYKFQSNYSDKVELSFEPAVGAEEVWIEISTDGGNTWNLANTEVALNSESSTATVLALDENTTYHVRLGASKEGISQYSLPLEVRTISMPAMQTMNLMETNQIEEDTTPPTIESIEILGGDTGVVDLGSKSITVNKNSAISAFKITTTENINISGNEVIGVRNGTPFIYGTITRDPEKENTFIITLNESESAVEGTITVNLGNETGIADSSGNTLNEILHITIEGEESAQE